MGQYELGNVHRRIANKVPPSDERTEQLHVAERYSKEALRIGTNIHGPSHEKTLKFTTRQIKLTEQLKLGQSRS